MDPSLGTRSSLSLVTSTMVAVSRMTMTGAELVKYCNPYYGDPQKATPNFEKTANAKPAGRFRAWPSHSPGR